MRERGAVAIGALVLLLALLPLGAFIHAAPRFPGSLAGSLLGIAGALLILLSTSYTLAKRVPRLHDWLTRQLDARLLLALHIYAGISGAMLGLIHAAHTFNSPLGVSLTGIMILAILSGYAARYLLAQVARAIRGRKSELAALQASLAAPPGAAIPASPPRGPRGIWRALFEPEDPVTSRASPERIAGAIADTEYAIRSERAANRLFGAALNAHIALAIVIIALLALHIWAALYYGLRWL